VNKLEEILAGIEEKLSVPENATDASLFEEYNKRKHELEQKMYEWELLSEELENLMNA
jgi:ATP-binding cassette subfamily F protein 3